MTKLAQAARESFFCDADGLLEGVGLFRIVGKWVFLKVLGAGLRSTGWLCVVGRKSLGWFVENSTALGGLLSAAERILHVFTAERILRLRLGSATKRIFGFRLRTAAERIFRLGLVTAAKRITATRYGLLAATEWVATFGLFRCRSFIVALIIAATGECP